MILYDGGSDLGWIIMDRVPLSIMIVVAVMV